MKQIDLDDLPPRIAQALSSLEAGEELVCVQGGLVVARLTASAIETAPAASAEQPREEQMAEVLEQFNAMINDEF